MSQDQHAREKLNRLLARIEELERIAGYKHSERKLNQLNFSEALEWMKVGKKCCMWHRDDIYVFIEPASGNQKAMLRVKTIQGDFAAWTPNHHEIIDGIWRVIEDEK